MRAFCIAVIALGLAACGEEITVDANKPDLPAAPKVQCREVNGQQTLDVVEFVVQDLDGSQTLLAPMVTVGSVRLEMTGEALTWDNAEIECATESCQMRYSWERPNSGPEQIYCGEEGKSLTIEFFVEDEDGFFTFGSRDSSPLQ